LSLEPLIGDRPGPPAYLTRRLDARQRAAYSNALASVRAQFERLSAAMPSSSRLHKILRSIGNVRMDLRNVPTFRESR